MEDNNLNPSPIEVENVVTSPIPVEPQPKNNSALVILSFSLIILVGIIAFLGYQNYQLQKQISLLTAPSSSSTPLATADPTADWKTYINQEGKYQYSYPDSWKILNLVPVVKGHKKVPPSMKLVQNTQMDISKFPIMILFIVSLKKKK